MRHADRTRTHFADWRAIVLAVLVVAAVLSPPALARPRLSGGKRIAVLPPTDGTAKDAIITAKIAGALKKQKIQAVTGPAVKQALAGGLPSSDGDWVALALRLRVHGIVEPVVSQTRGKRRVEVVVHNGLDGSVAGRESFSAKGAPAKLAAVAAAGVWPKLGSTIRGTEPPKKDSGPTVAQVPAPADEASEGLGREPADAMSAPSEAKRETPTAAGKRPMVDKETESTDEADEFEAPAPAKGPRVLEVEIGLNVMQRVFEFTPASAGTAYDARSLLVPQARVAWFPFTYAGLFVAGEFNPALQTGSNPAYPTRTSQWILGVQARYPLSVGALALGAGYFMHAFTLGDPSGSATPRRRDLPWPDTSYRGLRVAASGRFHPWRFIVVGAEAGYRLVSSPGSGQLDVLSSHYFPSAKVNYGLDGSFFLGVGIASWLEIRGGMDYRRYAFGALVPGADNSNGTNATGALDQYASYTVSAVGVYGGK